MRAAALCALASAAAARRAVPPASSLLARFPPEHVARAVAAIAALAPPRGDSGPPALVSGASGPLLASRSRGDPQDANLAPFAGLDIEGAQETVYLPSAWSSYFADGSVHRLREQPHETVYIAKLSGGSGKVALKEVDGASEEARRELKLSQRLTSLGQMGHNGARGHIVSHFDVRPLSGATFVLTEAPDITLDKLLEKHEVPMPDIPPTFRPSVAPPTGHPMNLTYALPIFVDVLRGLTFLDDAGICHGKLSPESMILKGGRAIIDNLGAMCQIFQDRDPVLACSSCVRKALTDDEEAQNLGASAKLQAPEGEFGCPSGPADHAWTAGLMFAMMRMGYNPAERVIAKRFTQWLQMQLADMSREGQGELRRIVRDEFHIEEAPGFRELSGGEQHLLAGLLDKGPSRRWTATRALAEAAGIAAEARIFVPPARRPATVPLGAAAPPGEGRALGGLFGRVAKPQTRPERPWQ